MAKATPQIGKAAAPQALPAKTSLRDQHKQLTRQRILQAGAQVFTTRGYADATIDDLVAEAAVGRATFYLHFKSKLDVMRALIQQIEQRNHDIISELGGAMDEAAALRGWLARFVRHLAARSDLFLAGVQALASEPELEGEIEPGPKLAQQILAAALGQRGLGAVEADLRARLLVIDLKTAVHLLIATPERFDIELVVDVVASIWAQALGLAAPVPVRTHA